MTHANDTFSFSSDVGEEFVREVLQDLWPRTLRGRRIGAVGGLLGDADFLATLPTGAGKTAILTMFVVILQLRGWHPRF